MKPLKNQRGQGVVEIVLLMAITVGISLAITRYLQQKQFAQTLIGKPWQTLSGMIECGTWRGCGPGTHPGGSTRIVSYKPDE